MFKSLMPNLMVENVQATVDFYVEKLGFELITPVPGENGGLVFAIVKKDKVIISFQEKNNLIAEYETLATEKIKPALTLFIKVDNVVDVYEDLKTKTKLAKEMHDTFYGTKEFAVFDNNGNILTLAE